ncbi:MAG: hypothetical protein E7264_00900 [Lachnospiraceae bacterium]|nr:hypothetical protein [Lachnospiraceae bacterium]
MISPIHMQMTLPQSENAGNTRQFENQRVVNNNSFAANEVAKEVQHNSQTVIAKDPNEFAEYRYDAKEKGNGTYQDPRKRKRKNRDDDEELDENDGMAFVGYNNEKQPRVNIQI